LAKVSPAGLTAILNVLFEESRLQTTIEEMTACVDAGTVYKSVSVFPVGDACPSTLYVVAILHSC
jgi:hypothetical protein